MSTFVMVLAVLAAVSTPSPTPAQELSLVPRGAVWKYLDDGSDPGTAWRQPGFSDVAWRSGPAQLGYGDGDEATVVGFGPLSFFKYITTYFRRSFTLAEPSDVVRLRLRLQRDDGAVVYLNGVEVARSNLLSFLTIEPETLAFDDVSGGDEHEFHEFVLPAEPLRARAEPRREHREPRGKPRSGRKITRESRWRSVQSRAPRGSECPGSRY